MRSSSSPCSPAARISAAATRNARKLTEPTRGPDDETSERTAETPWAAPEQPTTPAAPPAPYEWTAPPPPPLPAGPAQGVWTPPPPFPPLPAQNAWTPPPGSVNTPHPAPNQWQGPSLPYQPGYWQTKPAYGSSALVTIAGIVLVILGGLFTLGGALFVILAAAGSAFIGTLDPTWEEFGSAAAAVLAFMALFILAIGV